MGLYWIQTTNFLFFDENKLPESLVFCTKELLFAGEEVETVYIGLFTRKRQGSVPYKLIFHPSGLLSQALWLSPRGGSQRII